jgi:hypothetical protein
MKRHVVALAVFWGLSPTARAEPCETSTVMRAGLPAPCTGILTPAARAAQCLACEDERAACHLRLEAAREAARIDHEAAQATIADLQRALADEAAHAAGAIEAPGFDWGAFGWGLAIGAVLVGGVAAGVVIAR